MRFDRLHESLEVLEEFHLPVKPVAWFFFFLI